MAIPISRCLEGPILKALAEKEMVQSELVELLAEHFGLTEEEMTERYEHSGILVFYNRVSFAKLALKNQGLITYGLGKRARITELGRRKVMEKCETATYEEIGKMGPEGGERYNVVSLEVFRVDQADEVEVSWPLYVLYLESDEMDGRSAKLVDEAALGNWLERGSVPPGLAAAIRQAVDAGHTAKYMTDSQRLEMAPSYRESLPYSFTFEGIIPF